MYSNGNCTFIEKPVGEILMRESKRFSLLSFILEIFLKLENMALLREKKRSLVFDLIVYYHSLHSRHCNRKGDFEVTCRVLIDVQVPVCNNFGSDWTDKICLCQIFNLSGVGALRHSKIFVNHICQSHETRASIATFKEFSGLPNIAGAIDGTHKNIGSKRKRCRLL